MKQKIKPDYADSMKCYVVGIPRLVDLNGHGELPVSKVIAKDRISAINAYLLREVPTLADEIREKLQRYGYLEQFAVHAPSHDILNRTPVVKYTKQEIEDERASVAKELARVCFRDSGDIEKVLEKLMG